jgi:hypothetical protein
MKFYSAIKNEIVSVAGKWMKLEMSCEINQFCKDKCHMFSLIWNLGWKKKNKEKCVLLGR